jgi:hypothetical protein
MLHASLRLMGGSTNNWTMFNQGLSCRVICGSGVLWGDLMDDLIHVSKGKVYVDIEYILKNKFHFVNRMGSPVIFVYEVIIEL